MKKYFGTDGIRGKALEKLNSNLAFKLGQAIAKSLKPMEVVIGEDTRQSSSLLAYGVAYGLSLAGVNVYMAGIVSTPMIALYSKETHKIGVMITASHNPYTDNGIKVFKNGYKMLDDEELELEKYIDEDELLVSNSFGKILFTDEVRKLYIDKVNSLNLPSFNQSIIYDSANGANYKISNEIMSHYAKNSLQIGNTPDGFNINLNVGSTYIDTISLKVKEHLAQIGLSYDGDGDRLLVVDHSGKLFDGDLIIYIIAKYLKKKGQLRKDTVVLT
ncbi:MAG TPA: phosphoglucosamine mutase, partial [Acholeplasma sp.]|nr:phosphoglucosamine mutase [Acholeplasma sp.]